MNSSAQDAVFALFTVGHSVSGQVEASIVAGLYFLAFVSFLSQSPVCKRWDKIHAIVSLCIFSAARGSGFLCRALAERHSTKARFEAYLILSSAATFLFIGALGDLLADWFAFSSGKGQMALSCQTKRRNTVSIKITTMLRSLYILGIIFAVVGIVAALRLFNIKTAEDFYQAQHGRRVSNQGFVVMIVIYTVFAFCCLALSRRQGPTMLNESPSRLLVIAALTASCIFLLVRSCFGFLSVGHIQFSQQARLLYGCVVLPELIALYIVAVPGLISGVGVDLADTAGIVPIGTSNGQTPMTSGSPPWGASSGNGEGQDREAALLARRGDAVGDAVLPLGSYAHGSLIDNNSGSVEHTRTHHGYASHHDEAAQENMQHASWQSMPGVNVVQPPQA